jgi:tRNA-specific 2-thiouridylase
MGKQKIAVGMSGGVDSTVAAYQLKQKGYEVTGVTMAVWGGEFDVGCSKKSGCYNPDETAEIAAIKRIAKKLGIKHITINLKKEYKKTVLDYFCKEYLCGKTPNPCMICNSKIKFGFLLDKAEKLLGFDYFATGHYARVSKNCKGRYLIKKGKDADKDQSYFLWRLKQTQLAKIMFPLGELTKNEVKKIAKKIGFGELALTDESQDFLGGKDYGRLFKDKKIKPGNICDKKGNILAKHKGIVYYTVGQRKGLGISGTKEPMYVTAILPRLNTVVVGSKKDLCSKELIAKDLNWITKSWLKKTLQCKAKIRFRHKEATCKILPPKNGQAKVIFDKPQMAITLGQSVVFYKGDTVLGGGIISPIPE